MTFITDSGVFNEDYNFVTIRTDTYSHVYEIRYFEKTNIVCGILPDATCGYIFAFLYNIDMNVLKNVIDQPNKYFQRWLIKNNGKIPDNYSELESFKIRIEQIDKTIESLGAEKQSINNYLKHLKSQNMPIVLNLEQIIKKQLSSSNLVKVDESEKYHMSVYIGDRKERRLLGNQCVYSIRNKKYHNSFKKAWAAKEVINVSLSEGYIILYKDMTIKCKGLSKDLKTRLKKAYNSSNPPVKIVLGSNDYFFIFYKSGRQEWCGPQSFGTCIKKGVKQHKVVNIGFCGDEGWVIIWSNSTIDYSHIPQQLIDLLKVTEAVDIRNINLGPNQEVFVLMSDHSVQAFNLSDSNYTCLNDITRAGGKTRNIIFGDNSSWYIRYWDGY